ncbi:protein gp27 [Asticcacaulis biprosthecium C19]|uniref:Protein gp27 n=1 Tax=Asticcacaulis biprosthecium C19 TaxID=715226 RepID=F4QGB1_9CAUL|nr:phage protein Gp27 family protein [Asticcacaulis biprosthecium]EGF92439.1 protein gp27 [Asticcacaulis biprosthecium C19]
MKKRHAPSSIETLPEEVRLKIGKLIAANVTLDAILQAMDELLATSDAFQLPSRSALGRYAKRFRKVQERLAQTRAAAETFAAKFGDKPDDQVGRLNIEMMQTIIFDLASAVGEADDDDLGEGEAKPVTLDPEQVLFLARSLQSLSSAAKTDTDRTLKIKEQVAKEAAKAVANVVKQEGISDDIAERLFNAVMGGAK